MGTPLNSTVVSHASRRRILAGGLAAFATLTAASLSGIAAGPALAHDADCPYCKLKVTQDTATEDNEVALRYGRKRIEYKCVFCAVADANNGAYKDGDVTILAPSEKKGQLIPITRKAGKWSAPAGTVFVAKKASHRVCQVTYRAFTSKAGFDAYVQKNRGVVRDAQPLTLDQLVALAK